MCWVATGAESVYNLSPTGFAIYLYQTDGEARDKQTAQTFWDDLDIFYAVYRWEKDWIEKMPRIGIMNFTTKSPVIAK